MLFDIEHRTPDFGRISNGVNMRSAAQTLSITLAAMAASIVLFGTFMFCYTYLFADVTVQPSEMFYLMGFGAFGTTSSWQNTLARAAPLILTALCTALPARVGLIIIGGEGALILGGLAAVSAGLMLQNSPVVVIHLGMAAAGMVAGGLSIAAVGALRYFRGVNETISSLLFVYIAIGVFNFLVEGPMRDPASLNKPSTYPIPEGAMLGGNMFGLGIHWGLGYGLIFCVLAFVLMQHMTFGFGARMVGGNMRAAQGAGLPVAKIILVTCMLAGAAAGLAGMVEVAAVHRQANGSLIAGYGFMGILVSFIARHQPLAIIPVAILFGGLSAASGLVQRRLDVPAAAVELVFTGLVFVMVLLFETLYGRFRVFAPREVREALAT